MSYLELPCPIAMSYARPRVRRGPAGIEKSVPLSTLSVPAGALHQRSHRERKMRHAGVHFWRLLLGGSVRQRGVDVDACCFHVCPTPALCADIQTAGLPV